jgi:hypothetical protein
MLLTDMMSEYFFTSWLEGNAISAPEIVRRSFDEKFPEAINVEWFRAEELYEAVFYDDEIEKISRFSPDGNWIETRTNLDITVLGNHIKVTAEKHGEIMNAILIEQHDGEKYEVIISDRLLKRFLLILSQSGKMILKQQIV